MKKLICKIFGHNFRSSTLADWKKDGTNFICKRCGKRVKGAGEAGVEVERGGENVPEG